MSVNVSFSPNINMYDDLPHNGRHYLTGVNDIKESGVIILYIYILPDMPTHGYKVGMTKCKYQETFRHALIERISHQKDELVLSDEDYEKYGQNREVLFWGISLKDNEDDFEDHVLHKKITNLIPGYVDDKEHEWFRGANLAPDKIKKIFYDYRDSDEAPYEIYTPRKEQSEAVEKMKSYFSTNPKDKRFLLNCKMRFGKCFTVYKYAEETHKRKILILTFVPAVEDEWYKNSKHIKTLYDYFTDKDLRHPDFKLKNNPEEPYVVFLSLQNYLGKDSESKETKDKIRKLQDVDFDLLVLDEYHFGAWNDRTQETIEGMDEKYQKELNKKGGVDVVSRFNISVDETLCLSGTPFKALDRGDFSDVNSYSYSYFDEQRNKYPKSDEGNFEVVNKDYEKFPDMRIYGYNMASLFDSNAPFLNDLMKEEKWINEDHKLFLLNKFFETEKDKDDKRPCKFIYEEQVLMWLDTLRGTVTDNKFKFPYTYDNVSDVKHSLWLMPTVNACTAMHDLLIQHEYFKNFEIINLSDPSVGAGSKALEKLKKGIKNSIQRSKLGTISLTVNKLTLGVTVEEWNAVFVLKDLASPEQYFQSIFRIQTPQVIDGEIKKKVANVYDFNIDRAASLMLQYTEKTSDSNITKLQIADLIVKYMPIYLNGNIAAPIGKSVFYELAQFGDTTGQPLSKKITNTKRTTHADDQTITDMLEDDECRDVINKVFAHARFAPSTKRTKPMGEANEIHKMTEYQKGSDIGHEEGNHRYLEFASLDDCQDMLNGCIEELYQNNVPSGYNEEQRKWFHDGVADGYYKGINAPIKKMQCGAADGIKFVKAIKEQLGENIKYNDETKQKINNIINSYLNETNNIPVEYRGKIYRKWYCDSFKNAVRTSLSEPKDSRTEKSKEDVDNVLKHILARLFQFLYISVYRETTFDEIFSNANPEVFLSAVGITKEEFQTLNKYHIFQENVLDRYINEFFVNETLGKNLSNEEKENNYYRNSFNWFGFGVEN